MNRILSRSGLTCIAVIAVFIGMMSAPAVRAEVSVEIRTVALTGDPAPDTEVGVAFSGFQSALVTPSGQVGINATLAGPGVDASNDDGIWVGTVETLTLAVRAGDNAPVPGVTGVTFSDVNLMLMNDAQEMAFTGTLAGGDIPENNQSLWAKSENTLSLIARNGDTPPDEAGMPLPGALNFGSTLRPRLDGAGRVTFFSEIRGMEADDTIVNEDNENDGGIWAEKEVEPDSLTLVLVGREGQPAPNVEGTLFCSINGVWFGPSSAGTVAFVASFVESEAPGVEPDCAVNQRSGGIWLWDQGNLSLFLRDGDPPPDETGMPLGDNVTFSFSASLSLNRFDGVAFRGPLEGEGVNSTNNFGMWVEPPLHSLRLVARTGDAAPDTEAGFVFYSLEHIIHRGSGNVAFFARVTNDGGLSTDHGIWAGAWDPVNSSHAFRLVARDGDLPPGTGSGIVFDAFDSITLNDSGQVAFRGRLWGPDTDLTNNIGLFAEDPLVGNLNLIARTGDDLEVRPGDFRTLQRLDPWFNPGTGEDGRNSYFSDLSQTVFWATFTDGSEGIFVATFVEGTSEPPPDEGSEPTCEPKGKFKTDCDTDKGGGGKGGGGKPPKR